MRMPCSIVNMWREQLLSASETWSLVMREVHVSNNKSAAAKVFIFVDEIAKATGRHSEDLPFHWKLFVQEF